MDTEAMKTREGLLEQLKQSALADVEQLTVTRERAALVMTDEAIERNAALFASKPEVGLVEFMDAQDSLGGKFAAFVAIVGNPFLVSCAAFRALLGGYDDLVLCVSLSGLRSMILGDVEGCISVISDVCVLSGIVRPGATDEENQAEANKFFADCLRQATEWALSTKDNPVIAIAGDMTPGVTH